MKAIENKTDIELLVNSFYQKVQQDPEIGYFFNKVANVNWEKHLPKMYQFWETLLLGKISYKGNPMAVHFPVNRVSPIKKVHFDRWLQLWEQSINENFSGDAAEMAITKAKNIASLMSYKMEVASRLED